MNGEPYIPAATLAEMQAPHPPGTRHDAMIKIAIPLIGNNMAPEAVYHQLRAQFPDPDKTEKEIRDVVAFAVAANPTPSGYGNGHSNGATRPTARFSASAAPKPQVVIPPAEKVAWWLDGYKTDLPAFQSRSPVFIPEDEKAQLAVVLHHLYRSDERVNVVCKFTVNEKGKANPQGAGRTDTREGWMAWLKEKGVPKGEAGAWMRPNPVKEVGSGKDGAITDDDIAAHRFLLLESDSLPLDVQLAVYTKLKLPIALVMVSGGESAHAWVRLDAPDEKTYTDLAATLIGILHPFGFDRANKNPSRLSRLPGAKRTIGATGDGQQRLLYLCPECPAFTAANVAPLEARLSSPVVSEKPMAALIHRAAQRYNELYQNRGKLGVPTGIKDFDELTGGLKKGQMIVIAAQTGGGKSTVAINMINEALKAGIGVALFTLEMDRDEICDLLVSINCSVDRNVFNHGNFSEFDNKKIVANAAMLASLPLWIFDDAVMTVEQIKNRTHQLIQEHNIGLVVIDYTQFVSPGDSFRDNREQQIASISRGFRSLAKDEKVPIICLSQLNDEGKLRESRVISHDAHIVMIVEEDGANLLIKVVKGRSIPKFDYPMKFEHQYARLTAVPTGRFNHSADNEQKQWRQGHPNARKQ